MTAAVPQLWADDFYILSNATTWYTSSLYNDDYKMTESNGVWTWSFTPTSSYDFYFRILGYSTTSNGWYNDGIAPSTNGTSVTTSYQDCAWNNSNAWKLTVTAGYTYTLYMNSSNQVKYSVTEPTTTTTYYITGDEGLGLSWAYAPTTTMTENSSTGIYTYTYDVTTAGTYYFAFANGQGSTWDDFNSNYRIGPNGSSAEVTLNGDYQTTQMAQGNYSYYVSVAAGTVTFYFNPTDMTFKVEGTTPTYYTYNIYIHYTGEQDLSNVYAYCYDYDDNHLLGDWGGTKLSEMQSTTINGYTYYYTTVTSYDTAPSIILNENQSSSTQTSAMTLAQGDNYFTYGGGSTVSGPNTSADALATYYITGSGLGLSWTYAPTTTMTYDSSTGYYSYTYDVTEAGTYNFVFGNGQGSDWNDFNTNYRIGPTGGTETVSSFNTWLDTQQAGDDNGSYAISVNAGTVTIYYDSANSKFKVVANAQTYDYTFYVLPSDGTTTPYLYLWDSNETVLNGSWPGTAMSDTETLNDGNTWYKWPGSLSVELINAIITNSTGSSQTSNITNLEPNTYYIKWDVSNNSFELSTVAPTASGGTMYMIGGYYYNKTIYSYDSNSGAALKYDATTGYYYINNVTLPSNSTFCFTTQLSDNWSNVGTRYGNASSDYVVNDGGTNYFEVTESLINTQMALGEWIDIYGEYKMFTAGTYNIIVSPSNGWVKLIKTEEASLSPMNVYLEQTSNVQIDNIQADGTVYTTDIFDTSTTDYWPLSAYNKEQGFWDPTSDAKHYPVTYVGDTTTVDGKTWWHWQVSASIADVFFTRTNTTPAQSDTIKRKAGVLWYTWDEDNGVNVMTDHTREYFESSAEALPTNATVVEGHYYVYFINTVGWDEVHCYAWLDGSDTYTDGYGRDMETWAGPICECIGIDPVTGYEVWRYDFGTISGTTVPDGIIFNDGNDYAQSDSKQQTGDFEFQNGGVYDYLGLLDGAFTLNNLIRNGYYDVRYTISNDLVGVYYDDDARTTIEYTDANGDTQHETIVGALYAKDLNLYGEKSVKPSSSYTDYVYDICSSTHTAGGSQIMIKKTAYDQSNWIKLVYSPNYDGGGNVPVAASERPDLSQYVDHIIPGGTLDLFMTDSINPTGHVMAIELGDAATYEPNVYVSANFNDTVVFNYTHPEWQLGTYEGNYRTEPTITWQYNSEGVVTGGLVTRTKVSDDPYYMYYVAPKPQEIAYITWVVYDNPNTANGTGDYADQKPYGDYVSGEYMPTTIAARWLPADPGEFYAPMNWNRSTYISGDAYASLSQLTDAAEVDKALGAWAPEYGPYSNGFMQYGGFKVNWSLFDTGDSKDTEWWQIFRPGQAYKFKAIIRYARGNGLNNSTDNFYYEPSNGDTTSTTNGSVLNAPRRIIENESGYANMYFTDYDGLNRSKFIIFPIAASPDNTSGSDMGNVTAVEEVKVAPTSKDIVSVRYYNLMGVMSEKPFSGINIVVTTYSDGTRMSNKILR